MLVGYIIVISMGASLYCMMLVAVNRYILIVKGRSWYNRIYTKANSALSLIFVSTHNSTYYEYANKELYFLTRMETWQLFSRKCKTLKKFEELFYPT